MYKKYLIINLVLMVCILSIPYISLKNIELVEATFLTYRESKSVQEINGSIECTDNTEITLSYPVYIKKCHVKENQYVNKGQLLFTLDIEKMENTVKSNEFTQYTDTFASFGKEEFLELNEKIYASEAGYISELYDQVGTVVLSGEKLCVIEQGEDFILKITLNPEDYSEISVNDKVIFSSKIVPGRFYSGNITDKTADIRKEVSLTGNKTVVEVYASIDDTDEYVVSGLEVTGKILKNNNMWIPTLPYEYINQDNNGEYVNIVNNGEVSKVYIETGIEEQDYTEIKTYFDKDTVFLKNTYTGKGKIRVNYED